MPRSAAMPAAKSAAATMHCETAWSSRRLQCTRDWLAGLESCKLGSMLRLMLPFWYEDGSCRRVPAGTGWAPAPRLPTCRSKSATTAGRPARRWPARPAMHAGARGASTSAPYSRAPRPPSELSRCLAQGLDGPSLWLLWCAARCVASSCTRAGGLRLRCTPAASNLGRRARIRVHGSSCCSRCSSCAVLCSLARSFWCTCCRGGSRTGPSRWCSHCVLVLPSPHGLQRVPGCVVPALHKAAGSAGGCERHRDAAAGGQRC